MANKQGTNQIVDAFIGDKLIEARYIGLIKYFDAYTEITGTLPLSFNSRVSGALKNYRVYGTAAGAGVQTINLLDVRATDTSNGYVPNAYLSPDGNAIESPNYDVSEYIPVNSGTRYSYCGARRNEPAICFYDSSKQFLSSTQYTYTRPRRFTTPSNAAYVRISIYDNRDMLLLGEYNETPNFEPYGYKIPLTLTSGQNADNYPLYIGGTKLGEEEYVDYEDGKVYKYSSGVLTPTDPPTPLQAITAYQGENTLSDPMVQTEAYSLEQGNYGGNLGEQLFKHNSSHDYFNKTLRVPSILTMPAGQKWLIATKIGWATTVRIANSNGIITSMPGTNGATTDPIVIEASTSERKLGIHSVRFVNGSALPCVPSDYGGDLDITVVDAGALGSMTIKGRINSI